MAKPANTPVTPGINELTEQGGAAIDRLKRLVDALEHRQTRAEAEKVLSQLADEAEAGRTADFSVLSVPVPGDDEPLRLLLTRAIFAPEEWGRTFAEGLMKTPERFAGKKVVEVGTGCGWIGLFMLVKTEVSEVLGLDINPVAALVARLNTWLNSARPDGTYRMSLSGRRLTDAFRVAESDLLAKPLVEGERFDHVIGCIPQVLHPSSQCLDSLDDQTSDRELYDLSNYCFRQGIIEDRFGLPLIARALEESQLCLNPGGAVTLVLGGRPGPDAIESMFKRRGFVTEVKWVRRIKQADDTDLASLIELESRHGIKFHFFMSYNSGDSISAATAAKVLEKTGEIYHDLLVYEGRTVHEKATFGFLRNLNELGLDSLRRELDFSRLSEEQISFLESLTGRLLDSKTIPYPQRNGDRSLRDRLARFLSVYCNLYADRDDLFVGPERSQLMQLILSMVAKRGDSILVSESLEHVYAATASNLGLNLITGNDDLSELIELDNYFKPSVVLIAPAQLASPSPILVEALKRHAESNRDRLFVVDDSDQFDISSSLDSNALLRLVSHTILPENLVLIYGLIKNTVCPDLELSFLVNAPYGWIHGLNVGAELSYSRISWPAQLYYEWLFKDLLSFPFQRADRVEAKKPNEKQGGSVLETFAELEKDAVFAAKPVSTDKEGLIRLDYGELEDNVPDLLVKGLIRGILEPPSPLLIDHLRQGVRAYVNYSRNEKPDPGLMVFGQGVFPLFGAFVGALAEKLGREPVIGLPAGTYGPCYPMVKYFGGRVMEIETSPDRGFVLSLADLEALPELPDALWLTQPNNPSGLFFTESEVKKLRAYCAENEIYLLSDEIFFLLSDPAKVGNTPCNLSFLAGASPQELKYLFVTDGLSKAFAAGGLRAGFMITPDAGWAASVQGRTCLPPKSTLRAWDALYSAFLNMAPHELMDLEAEREALTDYLDRVRKETAKKRERIIDLLSRFDADDGQKGRLRGGLFVLGRLAAMHEDLAVNHGVLVNPDGWARTPGWVRIAFAIRPELFDEACNRLESALAAAVKVK